MTDTNDPIDWAGKKKFNLALQGGGLHGAFTWGVLDYLLEDARLDIEAITGTSAGAMNAVVLAEGYLEGARAGARKNLDKFWRSISDADVFLPPSESSWICFLDCRCRRWPRNGGPIFNRSVERDMTPRSASDIQDRLNEITFNGALLGEMRPIDFVNRLIASGKLSRDAYMRPSVHRLMVGTISRLFRPPRSSMPPDP